MNNEEEFIDEDGYPTDYALDKIENWNVSDSIDQYIQLMNFVKSLWYYDDFVKVDKEKNVYTFITGGWSGNENLISAMKTNWYLQVMYWYSSERGGKHVYAPIGYKE